MPFKNDNTAQGISKTSTYQIGESDIDRNRNVEQNQIIPWAMDPAASYAYYDCSVMSVLDSGIVVHNRLPQVNNTPDTLSSIAIDDPALDTYINSGGGVNLKCMDQYQDIVQRMGHARYWFRIWGQALRVGYQIPIPGIKTIGGVPAIPYDRNPQWAYNRILPGGNYSGVVLWHAVWSLWYTTAVPPTTDYVPAVDASAHITGAATPTASPVGGMQAPFSQADDEAETSGAPRSITTP